MYPHRVAPLFKKLSKKFLPRQWNLSMYPDVGSFHPKLSAAEIETIIGQVAEHIAQQRRTYRGKSIPLASTQNVVMAPFFPQSVLDSARLILLNDERVIKPPFYPALAEMGFDPALLPDFTDMAAITFVDTVVFHGPITSRLLFHEHVHVVQYEKLGIAGFAAKYVKGFLTGGSYNAIPLERNAYELDARFAAAPADAFSVEDNVQEWTDGGLF